MTLSDIEQVAEAPTVRRAPSHLPRRAPRPTPPVKTAAYPPPSPTDHPDLRQLLNGVGASSLDRMTIAASIITAFLLWVLGLAHVVSSEPLWLWMAVLLVSLCLTFGGQLRWQIHPSNALAHVRIGLQVVTITVIMYLTGWGPALGIGYIVIVRDLTTQMGSRHWRTLAVWSGLGCLGGTLAIAAGVAPTMLSRPSVYGLAAMVGAATVFAIGLLGTSSEDVESTQQSLVESEDKLRKTIETANEAYIELSPTGHIAQWNGHAELIFGWSREEAIGRRYGDLVFPPSLRADYTARLERALDPALKGGAASSKGLGPSGTPASRASVKQRPELVCLHRDGHEFTVEASAWPIETKDGIRLNIFLQDITERVAANEELQRSNDKFRLLFEQHPHPMWVYDQETLRFLEVNRCAVEHYGYAREEFLAMSIADIRPPEDVPLLLDHVQVERTGTLQSGIWRHRTSNGEIRDVEVSSHVLDFNGRRGALVMAQDITDRCRLEQQLRVNALHDPLTGLPNRSLLLDRIDQLIAQAQRGEFMATVMCVNIDNFKLVNDAYGHDVGDELLRAVGDRLAATLRAVDTVGRIGGDEFVILAAPGGPSLDPEMVAQKILDLIRSQPFHIDGHDLAVTASVGIDAGIGRGGVELIRNADVALVAAKAEGGNRLAVFAQAMQTAVHNRTELAMDLREAVASDQFECFYQPVVNLKDLTIVGVEALARWHHPDRGLLHPAQFISLAEDLGLIGEIGNSVLRQACAQGAQWQRQYEDLSVAVNVSVFQLRSNEFLFTVADALERSHFNPQNLILEITESVLIDDPETIIARLKSLKEIGVRLAIDDFGTGYSSFSYLRQLPFDILKIDQSFIASIGDSSETVTMLRTMIRMGRQLNLEIVAEGVEDEGQLDVLKRMRCQTAQGYLFSRPYDAATTTVTLQEWAAHGRPAA
jgi:diguanylate cyclase (GGDEF)-like protein/PAS domain S-box-containing protein